MTHLLAVAALIPKNLCLWFGVTYEVYGSLSVSSIPGLPSALAAVVPRVINENIGRRSLVVHPREATSMATDMEGLCAVLRDCAKMLDRARKLGSLEPVKSLGLLHGGDQVLCDGTSVTDIAEHEAFFHRPRIVTVHKTTEAIVAVFATSGMVPIHGLAFDEESVVRRKNRTRLFLVVAQSETKIRRLCEPSEIEVLNLPLPDHCLMCSATEPFHASGLPQIVFDDSPQSSGNRILFLRCQREPAGTENFEGTKHDPANQEDYGQPKPRMRQMVSIGQHAEGKQPGCPVVSHASSVRPNAPR